MKTWYIAVCDVHKEACHILVSNPSCSASYLSKYDEQIQKWLEKHYGCNLRLIHQDDEIDFILKNKYYIEDYRWNK